MRARLSIAASMAVVLWSQPAYSTPAPTAPGVPTITATAPHPARPAGADTPTERRATVAGEWKCLVILVDFADYRWDNGSDPYFANTDSAGTYTPGHFQSMLFSEGTYRDPWAASSYTGSMRDFYAENSHGTFSVTGVVTEWLRAPHTYGYYCNADGIPGTSDDFGWAASDSGMVWDLVRHAVAAADPTVDFSQFDNDGDGTVDGLFIVHAGPGAEAVYTTAPAAAAAYAWSHKWAIPQVFADGVRITNYTIEPEDGKVGVFCHEFGHELGLPDLYDLDGSSEGLGEWDVMASGGWCFRPGDPKGTCPSHFSAWSKAKLAWVTPVNVTSARTAEVVPPAESAPVAYRLWTNGLSGTEYFLVENRQNIGFDAGLTRRQNAYGLPAARGLMIYHVDDAVADNTNESHKRVDVEEAAPFWNGSTWIEQLDRTRIPGQDQPLANGNRGDDGDPWPGWAAVAADGVTYAGARSRDAFTATTVPSSHAYSGAPSEVVVANIAISGTDVVADLSTSISTAVDADDRDGDPSFHATSTPLVSAVRPSVARTSASFVLTPQANATARATILGANGRVVRLLAAAQSGARTMRWDLRDDLGRDAPAGVYVVRAESGGRVEEQRVCVVR